MQFKLKKIINKFILDYFLYLKRSIILGLRKFFSSVLNIEVRKIKPPFKNINPLALSYSNTLIGSRISLDKSNGIIGYFYRLDGMNGHLHPFICALKQYHNTQHLTELKNAIKDYSDHVNIKSISDFIGINIQSLPDSTDPQEIFFPWIKYDKKTHMDGNLAENMAYGYHSYESVSIPPLSARKIDVETKRLFKVYRSIKKNGYDIKNPIEADLLIRGSDYRWVIIHGHHRAAALEVLGTSDKTIVKIRNTIRVGEVKYWPEVESGIFSEEEAAKVFNNVFDAIPPSSNKKWLNSFNSNN